MTCLRPEFFYLLLALPLIGWAAVVRWKAKKTRWAELVSPRLVKKLIIPSSANFHFSRLAFLALGIAGLIAAVTDPSGQAVMDPTRTTKSQPRTVLICLDLSYSMRTIENGEARLEKARLDALQLAEAFRHDDVGLLIFSGEALLLIPPTSDKTLLSEALLQVTYDYIPIGGSDIRSALKLAHEVFKNDYSHSPALLFLSDGGDDLPDLSPETSAFATEKTPIHVLAYGTPAGALIPDPKAPDGIFRDREGKPVLSRLNEKLLQSLASSTRGSYHRKLDSEILRDLTSREEESSPSNFLPAPLAVPLFQWFLLPAIIFLSLSLLPNLKLLRDP